MTPVASRRALSRLRLLAPFTERRTYLETADLVLDLGFSIVWFSVLTALIATGAGLLVTLVGVPVLSGTLYVARRIATLERRRARALLRLDVAAPSHPASEGRGIWSRIAAPFVDHGTRRELLYLWLVHPVVAVVNFCGAVIVWGTSLWAITLPAQATYSTPKLWTGRPLDEWQQTLPIAFAGIVTLIFAPWVIRLLAANDRRIIRWGLATPPPAGTSR